MNKEFLESAIGLNFSLQQNPKSLATTGEQGLAAGAGIYGLG
jgi:hypothetical protein